MAESAAAAAGASVAGAADNSINSDNDLARRLHDLLTAKAHTDAIADILKKGTQRRPLAQRRAALNAAVTTTANGRTTETLLQTAHRLGRSEVVGLLLEAGAEDVGHKEGESWSQQLGAWGGCPPPVALAIAHGQPKALRAALQLGNSARDAKNNATKLLPYRYCDETHVREETCTAAHLCVNPQLKGDKTLLGPQIACLQVLTREFGVRIDAARDFLGRTPTHWLAEAGRAPGREEALDFLLELGASLNARTHNGQTPIFEVVVKCNVAMLKLLLSKKASADAVNNSGYTPLIWACQSAKGPDRRELILELLAASSAKTRRAVVKGTGWSAADFILTRHYGGELEPWECEAVAAMMASGARVKPEHAQRGLPGVARLGIRLEQQLDERGLSDKTCWRKHEAMVGLAFDVADARQAEAALEAKEKKVAELEAELRALGVGVEETDDEEEGDAEGLASLVREMAVVSSGNE